MGGGGYQAWLVLGTASACSQQQNQADASSRMPVYGTGVSVGVWVVWGGWGCWMLVTAGHGCAFCRMPVYDTGVRCPACLSTALGCEQGLEGV